MSNIKKVTKCPYCGKPGFGISKNKLREEILDMIGFTGDRTRITFGDGNFSRDEMHSVYIFIKEVKKRIGGAS